MGFSKGCSEEQPCQRKENPVLPALGKTCPFFTWINPVLALLKSIKGSVSDLLRVNPQSSPTRIPQSVNSGVSWLLCKKSNKTSYLKYNELYQMKDNLD